MSKVKIVSVPKSQHKEMNEGKGTQGVKGGSKRT